MRTPSILVFGMTAVLLAVPARSAAQPRENPSAVYATFERKGAITELIGLAVGDLSPGAKVILSCSGTSCPWGSKTVKIDTNVKMLALTDMFVDPTFQPGTTIEIRVTQPKAVEKVYQYLTQASEDPKLTKQCIPPGSSSPVAC